ncbi:MAG: asparagine synthase-related protein [Acidimicrobiales bacterium]
MPARVDGDLAAPWTAGRNPLGLTGRDVATGMVFGSVEPEPWPETVGDDPLAALEAEALALLERGRCVVAFSGGRDSSAVLAVFLRVARREGLEEPVAMTARFPGDAAAEESDWQEHVVAELGVRQWEVVTPGDDLDLLGPVATRLLGRHGLLWPPPFAALWPMVQAAGNGVLVTGEGGDEVFGNWSVDWCWRDLRRGRPDRAALRALAFAAMPPSIRRRRARRRVQPYQRWLRGEAHDAQRQALADEQAAVAPLWWPDYLRKVGAERDLRLTRQTFSLLCGERGGTFAAPLLAPTFLAALARRGGRTGLGDRSDAMVSLFSSVLRPEILTRTSKATFGDVFFGEAARAFAREWDATGLDPAWVDPAALRVAWAERPPVYGSALPLQAAWLAAQKPSQSGAEPSTSASSIPPNP